MGLSLRRIALLAAGNTLVTSLWTPERLRGGMRQLAETARSWSRTAGKIFTDDTPPETMGLDWGKERVMWKREEPVPRPAPLLQTLTTAVPLRQPEAQRVDIAPRDVCIGPSVVIKGQLSASEDLTIAGRVEGTIEVRDHILMIAHTAHISAELSVKTVLVAGMITGNIVATEKVEIRENGSVEGNIAAPRIAISEDAYFRGQLDMQRAKAASKPATADPR